MQDKLAEAQRKGLDLNDQVQLCRDQLEATKVLYCSMQCFVCGVCVYVCVCDVIRWKSGGLEVARRHNKFGQIT